MRYSCNDGSRPGGIDRAAEQRERMRVAGTLADRQTVALMRKRDREGDEALPARKLV